jgi:hypothetical protein
MYMPFLASFPRQPKLQLAAVIDTSAGHIIHVANLLVLLCMGKFDAPLHIAALACGCCLNGCCFDGYGVRQVRFLSCPAYNNIATSQQHLQPLFGCPFATVRHE